MVKKSTALRTPATDPEVIRQRLRGSGLRSTAPRVAVLSYLEETTTPSSHAEIVDALAPLGFDRATVYRNLIDLTDVGLVTRTDLGDHVWRFELKRRSDSHAIAHPHFVCTDCGTVACLPGGSVRIVPGTGMPRSVGAKAIEVQVKGRCDRCA